MTTIRKVEKTISFPNLCRKLCIILIWITVVYSFVIQYKLFMISNGMLILGLLVLVTFIIAHIDYRESIWTLFTNDSLWMLVFMLYILPVGMITSPSSSSHISQWITSMEYMLMMMIISSLIMYSGKETFHLLLFVVAILLVLIFIRDPVKYPTTDRYSISTEVNPNGLGMTFTTGIWATLYFQQKRKIPLLGSIGIIGLLGYGVFMTGSRKALIAAGIMIVLWFAFCYIPKLLRGNSHWKHFILISSVVLLIILVRVFVKVYAGSDIANRMDDLERETTTGSRSSMYGYGWMLLQKSPLFGLGFQGFKYYYGLYSHATIVEVPVSAGLCGSFIFFASYWISIKKCIHLYKYSRTKNLVVENDEIKMLLVLWAAMLFYCTCIIHPYQFDSFILFGIIFGQSAFIEKKLHLYQSVDLPRENQIRKRYKYIR